MIINSFNVDFLKIVDLNDVLEQVLFQLRSLTLSDAGTIYLKENDKLKFKIFQNNSFDRDKLKKVSNELESLELSLKDDQNLIAVKCLLTRQILEIDKIYENSIVDLSGTKFYDKRFEYKSHSMLSVPLIHPLTNEPIGVLQLINKVVEEKFCSYDEHDIFITKIATDFISMIISQTLNSINNLKILDTDIKNSITNERDLSYQNQFKNLNRMLITITQQWRDYLNELSINNIILNHKIEDKELANLVNDSQIIIEMLASNMTNFLSFFEINKKIYFQISKAYISSKKMLEQTIKNYDIKMISDIKENIEIYGELNIFTQIIFLIFQNSIEAFKTNDIEYPWIKFEVNINSDKKIVICIEDNAGGIEENLIEEIFKIKKVTNKNKHYSLNLATIKTLLEINFNGNIFLEKTIEGLKIVIIFNMRDDNEERR